LGQGSLHWRLPPVGAIPAVSRSVLARPAWTRAAWARLAVMRATASALGPAALLAEVAARRAATALSIPVFARWTVVTGKTGVLIDGGRTLRPSRQEKFFQVELGF